jgi:antitoxin component of MazEF toxin-antitoxin module
MKGDKGIRGASQFSTDRRVMRLGGSLVVGIPREVVEQWDLERGDEMRVSVEEGVIKIVPKQPTKVESISEEMIEAYSRTMKGIQARVTLDAESSAIRLEFSGENRQATDLFLRNLWRNLPVLLRLLGLGSVEERPSGQGKASDQEEA